MLTYEQAVEQEKVGFKDILHRLELHRGLFPIAHEYIKKFRSNCTDTPSETENYISYASGSLTIQCLGLMVHIGEEDTIKTVLPTIDEMIRDPRLEVVKPLPKTVEDKYEPFDISFKLADNSNGAKLLVRIWIYNSTKCKLVGTGKHKEIMEIVCEE